MCNFSVNRFSTFLSRYRNKFNCRCLIIRIGSYFIASITWSPDRNILCIIHTIPYAKMRCSPRYVQYSVNEVLENRLWYVANTIFSDFIRKAKSVQGNTADDAPNDQTRSEVDVNVHWREGVLWLILENLRNSRHYRDGNGRDVGTYLPHS